MIRTVLESAWINIELSTVGKSLENSDCPEKS